MKSRLILIALTVLLTLSPVPLKLRDLPAESLSRYSGDFTNWQIQNKNMITIFDSENDQDCVETSTFSVRIVDCDNKTNIKWQSPAPWKITETITADLNRDEKNELVMVVWRPHQPWPIDSFLPSGGRIADFHDRSGISCHLILIGWDGDQYRELWAGSSLINPVFNIHTADLDYDGNEELVALEGKYDNKTMMGDLTVWDWSGFGFRLRDRLKGNFSEFGIVSVDQNVLIVTE